MAVSTLVATDLPREVLSYVMGFLDGVSLAACGATCRTWRALVDREALWFPLVMEVVRYEEAKCTGFDWDWAWMYRWYHDSETRIRARGRNPSRTSIVLESGVPSRTIFACYFLGDAIAYYYQWTLANLRFALAHGMNPDYSDLAGTDALTRVSGSDATEIILRHGGNPDFQSDRGVSRLSQALDALDAQSVRLLVGHGATVTGDPDGPDSDLLFALEIGLENAWYVANSGLPGSAKHDAAIECIAIIATERARAVLTGHGDAGRA